MSIKQFMHLISMHFWRYLGRFTKLLDIHAAFLDNNFCAMFDALVPILCTDQYILYVLSSHNATLWNKPCSHLLPIVNAKSAVVEAVDTINGSTSY